MEFSSFQVEERGVNTSRKAQLEVTGCGFQGSSFHTDLCLVHADRGHGQRLHVLHHPWRPSQWARPALLLLFQLATDAAVATLLPPPLLQLPLLLLPIPS